METISLPLPPGLRGKLLSAGFSTVADFHGVGPVDLARDAYLTHEEALNVLKLIPNANAPGISATGGAMEGAKSAWELLSLEKSRKRITTLCPELDRLLGGGIAPGEVTEICGVPGIGKTQVGIQLAVNVQIPLEFEGLGGQALYIDTEGSFMAERALEVAHGMLEDVRGLAAISHRPDVVDKLSLWTADDILSRIFYYRVHDYTQQIAIVNCLVGFLERHPQVKVVVIDSITFHFRQDFTDMALRTRLLAGISQKLMSIASKFDTAVVLANQVTIKASNESFVLVPALGESWSHACTNRLTLFYKDDQRMAYLNKSPSLKNQYAPFYVTNHGIRSAPSNKRRRAEEDETDVFQE